MGIFISILITIILIINWYNEIEKDAQLKSLQKKHYEEEKIRYKELCEESKRIVINFKQSMYVFGAKNKRVQKNIYDIEEGGEYLTEYDKKDCYAIDVIIDEELSRQSAYFKMKPPNIYSIPQKINQNTEEKIKERILSELRPYSGSGKNYLGFD